MSKYELIALVPEKARAVLGQIGINCTFPEKVSLESDNLQQELELQQKLINNPDGIFLGSKTELLCDGEKIGCPENDEEAREILTKLSGKTHTRRCEICIGGGGKPFESFSQETLITFKELSEKEIENYIASREYSFPGGYDIEGKGAFFATKIEGDYTVVKGMPVSLLCDILKTKYEITPASGENIWQKGSKKDD